MSFPAARVGDMHMCPMVTPVVPPIPHVGGPILPPGVPTVLIAGMPAATITNMCMCVGPPDIIVKGAPTTFIMGKPAARVMDMCAHGGMITVGCPTVLIGDSGSGSSEQVSMSPEARRSAGKGASFALPKPEVISMKVAKATGAAFVKLDCACVGGKSAIDPANGKTDFVEIDLVDERGLPVAGEVYEVKTPDGEIHRGTLDANGHARVGGIPSGECEVTFPELDERTWKRK